MINLKKLKGIFNQATLITICGSPVKVKIEDLYISLSWRGLSTGQQFCGGINKECLEEATVDDKTNVLKVKLAWLDEATKTVKFSKDPAPITFWHKIEMPII